MAITVQAGTGSAGTSLATITPALPASVTTGDLLILVVDTTTPTTATSPGYTQVYTDTDANDQFTILTKTAGASEAAPVVTLGAANDCCAMVIRVRDCDTATGPAQITGLINATTATPSIDPPTAGSVKIGFVHSDPTTAGSVTWTGGTSGLGEIGYLARAFISAGYKLEDTAGTLTFTTTVAGSQCAVVMSIAPAAGGTAILGTSVQGATGTSTGASRMFASKYTLASAATLQELHGWIRQTSGAVNIRIVMYKHVSGTSPRPAATLVAYTAPIALGIGSATINVQQAGFSVPLAAADYWIGFRSDAAGALAWATSGGSYGGTDSGAPDPPPDPFGSAGVNGSGGDTLNCWAVVGAAASTFVPQVVIT